MIKPVTVHIHGQPVVLTVETIKATLQHYADHERLCADAAINGEFRVNDLAGYLISKEQQATEYERQIDEDVTQMSLAFVQQAYYIQSGESVPMLSK